MGYPYAGPGDVLPPSYERAARALTDAELEEEIFAKLGGPEYQAALVAEAERRAKTLPS